MQAPRKLYYMGHSCKSLKSHTLPNLECRLPTREARALKGKARQILLDGVLTTTSPQVFRERGVLGVEIPLGFRPVGSALARDTSMVLDATTAI